MRAVFVLTQDRGGPVDLTVTLAREIAGRPDRWEVSVVGPEPVTSAGTLDGLLHPAWMRSKTDVRGAAAVRAAIDALRPDVVHAQDRRAGLVTAVLGRRPGRLLVSTYHGVPDEAAGAFIITGPLAGRPPTGRAAAVLAADAIVARLMPVTVTPSYAMASFLRRRLRVPAERVHVIPNGVALPSPRPPSGPARRFVSVSTFSTAKSIPTLLEAFGRVASSRPGLRLVLVGDGETRPACERQAATLGLGDRVQFTGYRTDVPTLLAAADAFVVSSVNENLPLALLEAMGAGLACVAARVGGIAEALDDETGLLFEPGDPEALATALAALADQDGLAPKLGQRAAQAAAQRFSAQRCADAHLELWERLAGGPG